MKTQDKRPQVLALLKSRPQSGWTEISYQVGLSKERVRQIAKAAGYTRRDLVEHPLCRGCGKRCLNTLKQRQSTRPYYCRICRPYNQERKVLQVTCDKCGKSFHLWGNKRKQFLNNRKQYPSLRSLCSDCRARPNRDKVGYFPCGRCGTSITKTGPDLWRTRSDLKQGIVKNVYCKECYPEVRREQARYAGKVRLSRLAGAQAM